MNLLQKLAEDRKQLRQKELKKSGNNTYSNYDYFELGDFLEPMLDIFDELGLISFISFGSEVATLAVIDQDNPDDKIAITSPMSTAKLKACHEVQNLGAVQTYLRRYLYIALMELSEHDACDGSDGIKEEKKTPVKQKVEPAKQTELQDGEVKDISADQVKRLCTLISKHKRDMKKFDTWLLDKFQIDSKKKIPSFLYEQICDSVISGKE